jgi:Penicillin binding protein transpeptidase domain/Penicillin-binding Protein dimerisation domain
MSPHGRYPGAASAHDAQSREQRHRERARRVRLAVALAGSAFVLGAIVGANHGSNPAYTLGARFVGAWAKHDYLAMYQELDGPSKRAISPQQLADECASALRTATATRLQVLGAPRSTPGGLVAVPVRVRTRLFGTLRLAFDLKIAVGASGGIAWSRSLSFPGLRPGEVLTSKLTMPPRATLLARDGSVLATGNPTTAGLRASPLGALAAAALGEVGPLPQARAAQLEAQGIPAHAIVGVSGAEEALDASLRGRPGGELLAGSATSGAPGRVLAITAARAAPAVRSTISPPVQRAAVAALGGQYGGIVAMKPGTGQILAVAGLGIDAVQPPGSTFKMVTVSGVLADGVATPRSSFPYATHATLDGVKLSNANGEECGGSLQLAFAVSCNSVFAPLGVKLGARRLVAMAERYGFNRAPGIPGAAESTLPAPGQIQGELALGSTAIGQGEVQASPLEMARVAATIADGGRRPEPTFAMGAKRREAARATSPTVAHAIRRMMIAVVREGTGTAAAIPGVTVAGKTGTAELGLPRSCPRAEGGAGEGGAGEGGVSEGEAPEGEAAEGEVPEEGTSARSGPSGCHSAASEASDTDAWFAAFAPALHPRIVVCVLMVKDGAGGDTAAPVARQVIEAGLSAGV